MYIQLDFQNKGTNSTQLGLGKKNMILLGTDFVSCYHYHPLLVLHLQIYHDTHMLSSSGLVGL